MICKMDQILQNSSKRGNISCENTADIQAFRSPSETKTIFRHVWTVIVDGFRPLTHSIVCYQEDTVGILQCLACQCGHLGPPLRRRGVWDSTMDRSLGARVQWRWARGVIFLVSESGDGDRESQTRLDDDDEDHDNDDWGRWTVVCVRACLPRFVLSPQTKSPTLWPCTFIVPTLVLSHSCVDIVVVVSQCFPLGTVGGSSTALTSLTHCVHPGLWFLCLCLLPPCFLLLTPTYHYLPDIYEIMCTDIFYLVIVYL